MSRKDWSDDKLFFRLLNNKSDRTYWDNIEELRKRGSINVYDKCLKYIKSNVEKHKIIGIDELVFK